MSQKPVLVIMAAGMGSRYGGLKQIDPVDPYGNIIIDFSIFDAREAGFEKVIFIIKKAIEEDFKIHIGNRISKYMDVAYVYQELDKIPEGYRVPEGRVKPWGTGHAVLCCKDLIDGPFAVINADDYYGKEAFHMIYDQLSSVEDTGRYQYTMVGYKLYNTLTENGYVARGVCRTDADSRLVDIHERTRIEKHGNQAEYTEDDGATWTELPESTIVSMNMWGFTKSILGELENRFGAFLDKNLPVNPMKCEYFLPFVVDELLKADLAEVTVLKSVDRWYGVTYKKDKETVVKAIRDLKDKGLYPEKLWEEQVVMSAEMDKHILKEAAAAFATDGEAISCERYGNGHINDTFRLICENRPYILQRMNTDIFQDPVSLMRNIEGVTTFLRQEVIKNNGDPDRETLNLIKTREGATFYVDSQGNYWRMYLFIEGATCYNLVEKPEDFYQSGKAFGHFQRLLARYPARELAETIPGFHDTPGRFRAFRRAVEEDICGRASEVQDEIRFVMDREQDTGLAMDMLAKGELPLRVTHNDTKLNNIMIDDKTGQAICIIDLDTVMPGLSIFDFGDSIRFGANTAEEDETDLSKVSLSIPLFEIYTRGFLEGCAGSLTEAEVKMLPQGARLMTLECGIRFLTDYLSGDTYFKIAREKHNLDRCRTQFGLVEDMEKKWGEMERIVEAVCKG